MGRGVRERGVKGDIPMARTSADGLLCQNNSRLDSFLKRNTNRDVYERIRFYEPCVVVSGSVKKVFMHVILTDERVYLSEYPPRALREALSFRHVTSIELVRARYTGYIDILMLLFQILILHIDLLMHLLKQHKSIIEYNSVVQ